MRLRFLLAPVFILISLAAFARVEFDEVENIDQSIDVPRISAEDIQVEVPGYVTKGNYGEVKIKFVSATHPKLMLNNNVIDFIINGYDMPVTFTNGEAIVPLKFDRGNKVSIYVEDFSFEKKISVIPGWTFYSPFVVILIIILAVRRRRK